MSRVKFINQNKNVGILNGAGFYKIETFTELTNVLKIFTIITYNLLVIIKIIINPICPKNIVRDFKIQ